MPKTHSHTVADRVQTYLALSQAPKDYRHIARALHHPNAQHLLRECRRLVAAGQLEDCGLRCFRSVREGRDHEQ